MIRKIPGVKYIEKTMEDFMAKKFICLFKIMINKWILDIKTELNYEWFRFGFF